MVSSDSRNYSIIYICDFSYVVIEGCSMPKDEETIEKESSTRWTGDSELRERVEEKVEREWKGDPKLRIKVELGESSEE